MFNFPLKVCDIICPKKAQWNLENFNLILVHPEAKVSNINGDKL